MNIAYNSKSLTKFFKESGIKVDKANSASNKLRLINQEGKTIDLWSELESPFNIPCIYIENEE